MEKLRKLTQMTEHPERYSDEEWQEIFNGETVSKEETESAWKQFKSAHFNDSEEPQQASVHKMPTLFKMAAMFIGILLISGIAVAAIVKSLNSDNDEEEKKIPTTEARVATPEQQSIEETGTPARTVVFEDAELQQIVDSLSIYYKVKPAYRQEQARHLRLYYEWDQHHSIEDVTRQINHFDHISISMKGDSIIIE
jgi:hypothetical protein